MDVDEALDLDIVRGLLFSAPHLQHVSISMPDAGTPGVTPMPHIHLNSLRFFKLTSGPVLSRAIPRIRAPQLKELAIVLLPTVVRVGTIADLLPRDSYPLMTEVTSMEFSAGPGYNETKLEGEDIKVTINTHFQHLADISNFSNKTSFSFAQITRLKLTMMGGPFAWRIEEFTNLQWLDLTSFMDDPGILSALSSSPLSVPRVPCPHLKEVTIHFYKLTTRIVDSLKQMVKSRKEAGNPLALFVGLPSGLEEIRRRRA